MSRPRRFSRRVAAAISRYRDRVRRRDQRDQTQDSVGRGRPRRHPMGGSGEQAAALLFVVFVVLGVGLFSDVANDVLGVACVGVLVLAALVLLGVRLALRRMADAHAPRPTRLEVPGHPASRIEIDPSYPGRTRIRIAAPGPLPMSGPARLEWRAGARRDDLNDMRWAGPGAEAAWGWDERLFGPLESVLATAGGERFHASLTPAGLLIHLPLLVPHPSGYELLQDHAATLADVVAGIAADPAVEGVSLSEPVESAGQCSVCWEPVGDNPLHCPICGAVQHDDCAEWVGGCGRFACQNAEYGTLERGDGLSRSTGDGEG